MKKEAIITIIYNNIKYSSIIYEYNFTLPDIITDVITSLQYNFNTIKHRLKYLQKLEYSTYNKKLQTYNTKSTLKQYYTDFSSIIDIGLYIDDQSLSQWIDVNTNISYTLDLDNDLLLIKNDKIRSIPLTEHDLKMELSSKVIKMLSL